VGIKMRDLTGPTQGRAIRDLLQALFVSEALQPSDPLWILSGWISDIPVIDNRARQFAIVDPDWPIDFIPLSGVFHTMLARGGSLAIVLREVEHNRFFLERLRSLRAEFPNRIRTKLTPDFHEKDIVGRDFVLSGSMNFTFRGLEVNDEHIILRTDPSTVAERRLTLEAHWREKLDVET
jgi:hypothetical protein